MSILISPRRYIKNFMPQFYNHEKKGLLKHRTKIRDIQVIRKFESSEKSCEIDFNHVNEL